MPNGGTPEGADIRSGRDAEIDGGCSHSGIPARGSILAANGLLGRVKKRGSSLGPMTVQGQSRRGDLEMRRLVFPR